MRRALIAGNWKMNGLKADLQELSGMAKGFTPALRARTDVMVAPPATLLFAASAMLIGTGMTLGAQDCHEGASGAHTGDVSASMLFDSGAEMVILGHSERRQNHGETSALIQAKVRAALTAGLHVILCVGETRAEREAGRALGIVRRQVRQSLPERLSAGSVSIAYEPVWAIGTGLTPTLDDIATMHADIRKTLRGVLMKGEAEKTRLLYGGSVKPENAAAILALADVDGALVGGASLKATDFLAIIAAA